MTPEQRGRLRENTVFYSNSQLYSDTCFFKIVKPVEDSFKAIKVNMAYPVTVKWGFRVGTWKNTVILWAGGPDKVEVIVE